MSGTLVERWARRHDCQHVYPGGMSALVPVEGTGLAACWICDARVSA